MSDPSPVVDDAQASVSHDHSLDAVPPEQRRSTYKLVAVAFGWVISISGFLVGGTLGGGLGFGEGVTAIVAGNVVLAVVASLIGLIGFRTGMTTYLISRTVFGRRGSVGVSLVLGILAMGFIGVLLDSFATAFTALVSGVPWTVVVVLFTLAVTATALFGFRGLAWISNVASPALVLFALVGLVVLGAGEHGFAAAAAAVPSQPIGFDVGVTAVIATWVTGAALTSDIARYAPSAKAVVLATTAGYVFGAGFFEFVAMISTHATGSPDFIAAMSTLGLLLPAVVVLVLALWTTTDNNLYSASLAFTNASKLVGWNVPKPVWVGVSTVIALGVAFFGFAANFLGFLLIIAVVTPPFAGVVISHFWVLGHVRSDPAAAEASAPSVRWEAAAAWVGTSVLSYFVALPVEPLAAIVVSGAAYALLASLVGARRGSVDAVATGTTP